MKANLNFEIIVTENILLKGVLKIFNRKIIYNADCFIQKEI